MVYLYILKTCRMKPKKMVAILLVYFFAVWVFALLVFGVSKVMPIPSAMFTVAALVIVGFGITPFFIWAFDER